MEENLKKKWKRSVRDFRKEIKSNQKLQTKQINRFVCVRVSFCPVFCSKFQFEYEDIADIWKCNSSTIYKNNTTSCTQQSESVSPLTLKINKLKPKSAWINDSIAIVVHLSHRRSCVYCLFVFVEIDFYDIVCSISIILLNMDDKVRKEVIQRKTAAHAQATKVCGKIQAKRQQIENLSKIIELLSTQVERLTKNRNQITNDITFYTALLKGKPNETDKQNE